MFDLNLEAHNAATDTVPGGTVTCDALTFKCGCRVTGYQHAGTLLVTGGRVCFRHVPEGREPVTVGLAHPGVTDLCADSFRRGWESGYDTGRYVGERVAARVAEARPFGMSLVRVI